MVSNIEFRSRVSKAWPQVNSLKLHSKEKKIFYFKKIKQLLKEKNACLIAHYYVDADIQELAEESGGILGDSLAMAKFGENHPAEVLVVAGVRFMGESVKILSPSKKVIMPTLEAECSLDLSCREEELRAFISKYPGRTVVVYANTSVKIKALSDWIVTSSNALEICEYLDQRNEKILWAPDKYLGQWIEKKTGADMVHYDGACVVHEEFKAHAITELMSHYPGSIVLAHPESPQGVLDLAEFVGSTSQLLDASIRMPGQVFIVATEAGILYKMKQASPHKIFIKAPTVGNGATCKACSYCPWMGMNNLQNLAEVLEKLNNEIIVPDVAQKQALIPLRRMLEFSDR